MSEIWKEIPGYNGKYLISNSGKVRSFTAKSKGATLQFSFGSKGRHCLHLMLDGKRKFHYIHRLVLETFVGVCPEGMECCHNDGNHLNNNLSNLRWDTKSSNVNDQVRHGVHNMSRKTHCKRGHEFNKENTIKNSYSNGRMCRICNNENRNMQRTKNKEVN